MRKLILGVALLFIVAVAVPVMGLPGVDPPSVPTTFSIVFEEKAATSRIRYDVLPFARADGWDFGDRESYRCAWVERFDAQGNLLFKVEFERSNDYPANFLVNDRGGVESGDGDNPPNPLDVCGSPAGEGGWQPAGEDHFPHHTHAHFFLDGEEACKSGTTGEVGPCRSIPDPQPLLDMHRDDCARGYWTPGDESGEAILWWDVDGPTHAHPGGPELGCGGGPLEPSAVARAMVLPIAANAGVCIHDSIDGSRCSGLVIPPPTPITLGGGRSVLTCPDGTVPLVIQTEPLFVEC